MGENEKGIFFFWGGGGGGGVGGRGGGVKGKGEERERWDEGKKPQRNRRHNKF